MPPNSPLDPDAAARKRQRPPEGLEKHHRRTSCFIGPHLNAAAKAGVNGNGKRRPGQNPHSSRRSSSSPPERATGAANPTATPPCPEQETTRNHRRNQSSRSPPSASTATPAGNRSSRKGTRATPATSCTNLPAGLDAAGEHSIEPRSEQGEQNPTPAAPPPPRRSRQEASAPALFPKDRRDSAHPGTQIHQRRAAEPHRQGWIRNLFSAAFATTEVEEKDGRKLHS